MTEKEQLIDTEYELNNYKTLMDKKYELKQSLDYLENKIENAQHQVSEKITDICDGVIKGIEFERTQIIDICLEYIFYIIRELKKRAAFERYYY